MTESGSSSKALAVAGMNSSSDRSEAASEVDLSMS